MKGSDMRRITRIYQHYSVRKVGRKKRYDGPYWYGYYMENGKPKRVYIGKDLPEGLSYLLEGRFKKAGYRNFSWPGRRKQAGR